MNADLPDAASAASSGRAGILLQLGFSNNPVIGLVGAPDLVLGLPVAGGEQKNNLVTASPDFVGRMILSIADRLSYGVAMLSHDELSSERRITSRRAHWSP